MRSRMVIVQRLFIVIALVLATAYAGQSTVFAGTLEIDYYQDVMNQAAAFPDDDARHDAYTALILEVADMTDIHPACAPLAANVVVWLIFWQAMWDHEDEFIILSTDIVKWQPIINQTSAVDCLGAA